MDEENFDFEFATARVLGRDIATTSASSTLSYITNILKIEADADGALRLVSTLKSLISIENQENRLLKIIQNIRMGIEDIVKK